ncbi:MAG: hypothetical protein AABX24_01465 [Nanoarchaeota archaeon]
MAGNKKNSEKEIEEAHQKVRGEQKQEPKSEQKKESPEKQVDQKAVPEDNEKSQAELAEEQSLAEQGQKGKSVNLEEMTRNSRPLPAELHDSQYVEQLSQKPMTEIYKEIKDIYKTVEDKGYLSPTEQKQVEYLSSAVQRKFEDEEQGIYSFSEQAARAASITQQLSATMMGSYKGKKMNEMYK